MNTSWNTPEHWQMLLKQSLTLLAGIGLFTTAQADALEVKLSAMLTAAFIFAMNAQALSAFIKEQSTMKQATLDAATQAGKTLLVVLCLGLFASPSLAQCFQCPNGQCCPGEICCPAPTTPTALLPWRNQMEQRIKNQEQQQRQAPAPQPIIVNPPLQQLPIAGPILQPLPIQGQPLQPLPIQGQPQQPLPIAGPPQQPLPINGQPLQPLPGPGQPQQQMPPATDNGPQTYSTNRTYALYRSQ